MIIDINKEIKRDIIKSDTDFVPDSAILFTERDVALQKVMDDPTIPKHLREQLKSQQEQIDRLIEVIIKGITG